MLAGCSISRKVAQKEGDKQKHHHWRFRDSLTETKRDPWMDWMKRNVRQKRYWTSDDSPRIPHHSQSGQNRVIGLVRRR